MAARDSTPAPLSERRSVDLLKLLAGNPNVWS